MTTDGMPCLGFRMCASNLAIGGATHICHSLGRTEVSDTTILGTATSFIFMAWRWPGKGHDHFSETPGLLG